MIRIRHVIIVCYCLILTGCQQSDEQATSSILVFSAASLRDVMQDIAIIYEQQTGISVNYNFAGSNVLARQISASPKADVFLSANTQWMDYLANENLLEANTRHVFLSNSLVFIAHQDTTFTLTATENILEIPFRYLSIGDPRAVPAGRYVKDYLATITVNQQSLWSQLSDKVLPAPDVKAATVAVENIPDIIGIVYKTDALASSKVQILYEPDIHDIPTIEYVAASIKKSNNASSKGKPFVDFLLQKSIADVFHQHGFIPVDPRIKTMEPLL